MEAKSIVHTDKSITFIFYRETEKKLENREKTTRASCSCGFLTFINESLNLPMPLYQY